MRGDTFKDANSVIQLNDKYLGSIIAQGYMLKTSSADELLHAVRKVAAGELAIEQEVSKKVEYHRNHIELHREIRTLVFFYAETFSVVFRMWMTMAIHIRPCRAQGT